MEAIKAIENTSLNPQISLCLICKRRNTCFIDIEFYRLEQKYSLRGITSECKRFLPAVQFQRNHYKDTCLTCEVCNCMKAKKYHQIQAHRGLKRVITECAYKGI